ncbi:hypothetical protein EN45_043930 [Penicillium chrysogenum]|uniref:Cell surface protein n=1 Tax=Penicillium chrysogenum TaxID=5076 RepID=A0A167YJJ5_PENCH|nr:hypothetical protein EN45_061520 [Penicillium chrysogenum]KZN94203.1 hypothetical protein EN45_043930 [Penicillium chrysogenum]
MLLTKFSSLLLLATQAAAHGLITRIMGANGVEMPGLTARQLINDAASVVTNAGGAILNGAQSAVDDVAGTLPRTESGAVTPSGTVEKGVEGYAGKGSSQAAALLYSPHAYFSDIKVNQDGAGPLSADIDATSGGTDIKAFKPAKVIQNIPGVAGFSTSSTMDYEVKVQLPSGMKCSGVVGNTKNVCIMRVRNNAISGPFGGSAAFTN